MREILGEIKVLTNTGEHGGFAGYAATYSNLDRVYDAIMPGAFTESISSFIADGVVLFNHDPNRPIGRVERIAETDRGLYVNVAFSGTDDAQRVRQLIQEGIVRKMSVQFRVLDSEKWTEQELKGILGERWDAMSTQQRTQALLYGRKILRAELYELGPVSMPANPNANIDVVKSIETVEAIETVMESPAESDSPRDEEPECGHFFNDLLTCIEAELLLVETEECERYE